MKAQVYFMQYTLNALVQDPALVHDHENAIWQLKNQQIPANHS